MRRAANCCLSCRRLHQEVAKWAIATIGLFLLVRRCEATTTTTTTTTTTAGTTTTGTTLPPYDPFATVCAHEQYDNVADGGQVYDGVTTPKNDIRTNVTHRYFYSNRDIDTINFAHKNRRLIISLENCRGIVYLFVRKMRRCYPDPYSCIDLAKGKESRNPANCKWTHLMSVIDGSKDGTPTFFEIPFTTTNYYFSIFSTDDSQYTFTVVSDIGTFPRPGKLGRVWGDQQGEFKVSIGWYVATYNPTETKNILGSGTLDYEVYAAPLLDSDNRSSSYAFLRPQKTMNTFCGLKRNTDTDVMTVYPSQCSPLTAGGEAYCNITLDMVQPERKYVFNVVVKSKQGFTYAYSGLIMRTQYDVVRQAASDTTLKAVGVVAGGSLGMVIVMYFMMIKLYG